MFEIIPDPEIEMDNIDYEALWTLLSGTRAFACYAAECCGDDVDPSHKVRMRAKRTLFAEVRRRNPQSQEEAAELGYQIMDDIKQIDFENYMDTRMQLALPDEQITADACGAIYILTEYFKDHPYPAAGLAPILNAFDVLNELVRVHAGAARQTPHTR